jgi:hypothetical protein
MAGTAAEIRDEESFEAWLKARPEATRRQEALALAHRAAMRVVPLLGQAGLLADIELVAGRFAAPGSTFTVSFENLIY